MMRRSLVALLVLTACSSDGGGGKAGQSGPKIEIVTAPFEQTLGAPVTREWSMSPFDPKISWTVGEDGSVFNYDNSGPGLKKFSHVDASVVWTAPDPVYDDGSTLHNGELTGMKDGGVVRRGTLVLAGQNPDSALAMGLIRYGADGKEKWRHNERNTQNDLTTGGGVIVLPSGVLVTAMPQILEGAPAPQVYQAPMAFAMLDDGDGHEIRRATLPEVNIPTIGGYAIGGKTPGYGKPFVSALVATADGGFVAAGRFQFDASIACGSEDDPQLPPEGEQPCRLANDDGFVARFDAAGAHQWTARLGAVYGTPDMVVYSAAAQADGSVIAVGMIAAEVGIVATPHAQALAFRVDPTGTITWAKAFPWGTPPGALFIDGTSFSGVIPSADNGADIILHPPMGVQCRYLHLDPSGAMTRLQILDGCGVVPIGTSFYLFDNAKFETRNLAKLAK